MDELLELRAVLADRLLNVMDVVDKKLELSEAEFRTQMVELHFALRQLNDIYNIQKENE